MNYWTKESNSETGASFEVFDSYLRTAHNGNADIDAFKASLYGEALGVLLDLRFRYEQEPMGERTLAFFSSLGLRKEMHEDEDYYTRWELLMPEHVVPGWKYPLIIANHGGSNPIEVDEIGFGYPLLAAKEGFFVLYLQNTNWQNADRVLSLVEKDYPVDRERIYITGYSQGGYQVTSTIFRIPWRLTAAAPCGNDVFRVYDNFNIPYTEHEFSELTEACMPIMQINGAAEASSFVPVNDWKPRKDWGHDGVSEPYRNPRRDDSRDPTRIHGGRRRFSDQPVPPDGTDKHKWMMERLNLRMATLQAEPRDADKCIAYLGAPEDEFHHTLGFYGDYERIRTYYGYKHYMLDIYNKEGLDVLRYVVVENSAHWIPVMQGPLTWEFFRQFRRDSRTGKVIRDVYSYEPGLTLPDMWTRLMPEDR